MLLAPFPLLPATMSSLLLLFCCLAAVLGQETRPGTHWVTGEPVNRRYRPFTPQQAPSSSLSSLPSAPSWEQPAGLDWHVQDRAFIPTSLLSTLTISLTGLGFFIIIFESLFWLLSLAGTGQVVDRVETTFLKDGNGGSIEEKADEVFDAIELVEKQIAIHDFKEVEAKVQDAEEESIKVQDVQEEVRMTDNGEGKRPFFFDPSLFVDEEDSKETEEVFTGSVKDQNLIDTDVMDNTENDILNVFVETRLAEENELSKLISQKDSDEKDHKNLEIKSESLKINNGRKATAQTFQIVEDKEEKTLFSKEDKQEKNNNNNLKEGPESDLQNKGKQANSDTSQIFEEKEEGMFINQADKQEITDVDDIEEVTESDDQNEGRKASPDIFQTLMALMLKDQ